MSAITSKTMIMYCVINFFFRFVSATDWIIKFTYPFSSPEPKAQVNFSDQNLSVFRRRYRKFFTFSSSPEPLGQFQSNLAQSILGEGDSSLFK